MEYSETTKETAKEPLQQIAIKLQSSLLARIDAAAAALALSRAAWLRMVAVQALDTLDKKGS